MKPADKVEQRQFLKFNVLILKICLLWPNRQDYNTTKFRVMKDMIVILSLMPCTIPIIADSVLQIQHGVPNLTAIAENLIALSCIIGMIYMVICFLNNRKTIMDLVVSIGTFKKYDNWSNIINIDSKANIFCKIFMFYGILGNFVYMLMPQLSLDKCYERKLSANAFNDTLPCGLVVRSQFPFTFDKSPLYELIFIHQIYTCTMVSIVVLSLTMLMCGLLMHIGNQLKNLGECISTLRDDCTEDEIKGKLIYIICYHNDIIRFSQDTAKAFSTMLLFYITLTSLVLSTLCFEIIMVETFEDSLRFTLHLVGWMVILLSICYNAQLLIDQSEKVSQYVYAISWFAFPTKFQRQIHMILMRAQKPLTLSAAGMGTISLPAFLKVLSTAYSFFTLLLKFKAQAQ